MVCFWNSSTLDALKRSAVWFGSLGGLRGTFGSGLESSQSGWGLANLCWCRNVGSRASKPVLAQHFVLGMFPHLFIHFGSLLKKLLFLGRTLLLRLQGLPGDGC